MTAIDRRRWFGLAVIVGLVYFAVGIVTGELAGSAGSHDATIAWRWSGWIISAVVYAAHIGYEQLQRRSAPRVTALHAAAAVAIGAFVLAVAAAAHALGAVPPPQRLWLYAIALVAWPFFTALPAFLVAFVSSVVLGRLRARA